MRTDISIITSLHVSLFSDTQLCWHTCVAMTCTCLMNFAAPATPIQSWPKERKVDCRKVHWGMEAEVAMYQQPETAAHPKVMSGDCCNSYASQLRQTFASTGWRGGVEWSAGEWRPAWAGEWSGWSGQTRSNRAAVPGLTRLMDVLRTYFYYWLICQSDLKVNNVFQLGNIP